MTQVQQQVVGAIANLQEVAGSTPSDIYAWLQKDAKEKSAQCPWKPYVTAAIHRLLQRGILSKATPGRYRLAKQKQTPVDEESFVNMEECLAKPRDAVEYSDAEMLAAYRNYFPDANENTILAAYVQGKDSVHQDLMVDLLKEECICTCSSLKARVDRKGGADYYYKLYHVPNICFEDFCEFTDGSDAETCWCGACNEEE